MISMLLSRLHMRGYAARLTYTHISYHISVRIARAFQNFLQRNFARWRRFVTVQALDLEAFGLFHAYCESDSPISPAPLPQEAQRLYGAEKSRVDTLLMSLRVQFPSGQQAYDSATGSISYNGENVNITKEYL